MTSSPRPHFTEQEFRKATASNPNQECVQVARRDGWAEIRDDKTPFGSGDDLRIVLTAAEFDIFQTGIRSGQNDDLPLRLDRQRGGTYAVRAARATSPSLTFTAPEITAFLDGVCKHEFDISEYPR